MPQADDCLQVYAELDEERQRVVARRLFAEFQEDFGRQGVAEDRAPDFLRQNFLAHNVLYTLWEDGEFAACASAVRIIDEYFVCNVLVAEPFRGRGLSRVVIEAAERFARSRRKSHVKLWCDKELVQFYLKQGYRWKESTRIGKDKTAEIMEKRLARRPEPSP